MAVAKVNSSRPLKPTLLVYDPAVPKEEAILVDADHAEPVCVPAALHQNQQGWALPLVAHCFYMDDLDRWSDPVAQKVSLKSPQ